MNNELKKLAKYLTKKIDDAKEELKDYIDESLDSLQTEDEEPEPEDDFEAEDDLDSVFEDEPDEDIPEPDDEVPSDTLNLQEDDFAENTEPEVVKAEKTNIKKKKVKVK